MGDATTREAEQFWGRLFDDEARPSQLLRQLLGGIADYISLKVPPTEARPLIPEKVNAYYRQVGGNYDPLFKDTPPAALSQIYATLGCRHTLQSTDDDFSVPSIPALEKKGFVRWQIIQILLDPSENVPYLQAAVRKLEIIDPSNGQRFPTELPASCFPSKPDPTTTRWHDSATSKLAQKAAAGVKRDEPTIRLDPPDDRPGGSGSRRSSHSPKESRRSSRSPQRPRDKSPQALPSARLSHGHNYDPRLAPPTSSSRRSSEASPDRRDRDSRSHSHSKHHSSRSPEAYYRDDGNTESRRRAAAAAAATAVAASSDPRRSRLRPDNHRRTSRDSTSSSSASSSTSGPTSTLDPSSPEPSPNAPRHSHRRSFDDELYRRQRRASPSHPDRQSRDRSRSPNKNRLSHPLSSSRVIPVIPVASARPVSEQYLGPPPGLARRNSGNVPTYVPSAPLNMGGPMDPAYMEIQPYERAQAQAFMNRNGGPPRGNYRGANVRFGDDQVLVYGEDARRRRRSVDDRDRPAVVYRPAGSREVRGVDGRRYPAFE